MLNLSSVQATYGNADPKKEKKKAEPKVCYTDEFKMQIVNRVLNGAQQRDVALAMGVSKSSVSRYVCDHSKGKLK